MRLDHYNEVNRANIKENSKKSWRKFIYKNTTTISM